MGTKLQELRNGCFAAAMDHEPMFVLLGRDPSAPALIQDWSDLRESEIATGKRPASDMEKVNEARQCADNMISWRKANDGAWREGFLSDGDETSEEIGAIAARLMHHPDPEVRRVAASALTQRPDNVKPEG